MSTEITMPKLSDTMTEGRLVAWRKNIGSRVERGEVIAEVETDKANMELESFSSGMLLETRAKPGDTIAVGTVIALVGEEGEKTAPAKEELPTAEKPAGAPVSGAEIKGEETSPEEKGKAYAPQPELEAPAPPTPVPKEPPAPAEKPLPETHPSQPSADVRTSPLVRRLAREHGVDLAQVTGSGEEGRILCEDLERHLKEQGPGEAVSICGTAQPQAAGPHAEPLSRMRAAIARKVSETWRSVPHFFVTVEADMGVAEQLYRELREGGRPVSINDLVVKACALALESFPRVNASFAGDRAVMHDEINIGIAVAVEEGLYVPVIRNCRGRSVFDIARANRDLVARCRSGRIAEGELSGGTFTVSNLGMYGVEEFVAVINSPEAAILAVGSMSDRPKVSGGQVVAGRLMKMTLSGDHRIIDGAIAAKLLAEVKRLLESPALLIAP